ncbi:hypothetical protein D8X55_02710 [Malacoplasma penetrans]|uniref:DUF31 domain-containing protein n=1 Tax=Malacoplasma penetrans (strain HF-2) TaxID=272633 RepID=Q8EW95_MALP2|nr:DUF31 family protein [Malacoplasma penetrans]RXY96792.1 hypothetical protein D8X55_02710 [Malacoplasma penetrans]BAC44101.1 conserved hypothetical protein [Malacoplasma penetrans HF-2]
MKTDLLEKFKKKNKRLTRNLLWFSVASLSAVTVSCATVGVIFSLEQKNGNSSNIPNDNSNNQGTNRPDSSLLPKGYAYATNTTSEEVNQYSIDHNKKNFFNYPVYSDFKGNRTVSLKADGSPSRNYTESPEITGGNFSLKNVLKTDKHAQLAKQVYSVGFHNGTETIGTAWILDYKLTSDNSYPLTWYFGTNAHVIDDLKVKDDKLYPEKFGTWDPSATGDNKFRTTNTAAISLWQLANPEKDKTYKNNSSNPDWKETRINLSNPKPDSNYPSTYPTYEGFYNDNPPVKTVFQGYDFLSVSPSDSSINSYSNKEEYADFAVFELTFPDVETAKTTTNSYADWDESLKFKYHKEDLVKNPSLKTEHVYEIGYPLARSTETNAYRDISSNVNSVDAFAGGYGLSKSVHYNTFSNFSGAFDGLIAMPWFGYSYEYVDNTQPLISAKKSTAYSTYGLIYAVTNGQMEGGSSGGLLVDDNGYALGIHFGSDKNAAVGSSQAFYSSGYDYKGYYGNHNLPQYDLIRGGYPLQKNSYFDGLVKLYGKDSNFKTRLFPNGLTSRN